jgi:hypothetical protein
VIGASSASAECEWCGIVPKCIVYSLPHRTRSVERHSEWEAANPTRLRLRAAVNFKPGPRQNWNSKATGSRSSTQRLSYALPVRDLVGAGTGVLFFRGVQGLRQEVNQEAQKVRYDCWCWMLLLVGV